MTSEKADDFGKERERLNDIVMKYAGQPIKRFYSLDNQVYKDGILDARTKELLGLVSSFVLRCDDCIQYHIIRCHEEGWTSEEVAEALGVGVIVGGTITIPHLRRAMKLWDQLNEEQEN